MKNFNDLTIFFLRILLGVKFKLLPPLLPSTANIKNKVGAIRIEAIIR